MIVVPANELDGKNMFEIANGHAEGAARMSAALH